MNEISLYIGLFISLLYLAVGLFAPLVEFAWNWANDESNKEIKKCFKISIFNYLPTPTIQDLSDYFVTIGIMAMCLFLLPIVLCGLLVLWPFILFAMSCYGGLFLLRASLRIRKKLDSHIGDKNAHK